MSCRSLLIAAALSILAPSPASAAVSLVQVTTAMSPVYVTHARDQRLFIVERAGRIRIFDRATNMQLGTSFLDISAKVRTDGERGLLSMAFHPDYSSNGFFYVYYTNLTGELVIERYQVPTGTPNLADPASARTLLTIAHPASNHNGGQLQIGGDGHLYAAIGDGGGAGDTSCNAQRNDTMLGKMLRLDVRQNPNLAPYYGIPSDNPFRANTGDPANQIPDQIWAFGFRNPWRFSFDRATGDLWVGDVGQDSMEEIDLQRAGTPGGRNYGWKVMEGTSCFGTTGCPAGVPACNSPALTLPIHTYPHNTGECSITGGFVYRGLRAPELAGRYVFADYCSGAVRTLRETSPNVWQVAPLFSGAAGLTSFGEDSEAELYATVGNVVYRLVSNTPPAVPATNPTLVFMLAVVLLAAGTAIHARRL